MKLTKTEHEKEVNAEKHTKKQEALQDKLFSVENELHSYQIQVLNLERHLKEYRSRVGYLQRQLGHTVSVQLSGYLEALPYEKIFDLRVDICIESARARNDSSVCFGSLPVSRPSISFR